MKKWKIKFFSYYALFAISFSSLALLGVVRVAAFLMLVTIVGVLTALLYLSIEERNK